MLWRLEEYQRAAAEQELLAVRCKSPLSCPWVPGVSKPWGRTSGWRWGHSTQQPDAWQRRGNPQRSLPFIKSYRKGQCDAPSHAESEVCSSDTLFSFCISWWWGKGHSAAVRPSTCQTSARGTRNSQLGLFSVQDRNLSLSLTPGLVLMKLKQI